MKIFPPPVGSERPENCPVDSFQQRTGGSPGQRERPRMQIPQPGGSTAQFELFRNDSVAFLFLNNYNFLLSLR